MSLLEKILGLLLPWSRWGAQRTKLRYGERRRLIRRWEAMIACHLNDPDEASVLSDPDYVSLQAHLRRRVAGQVEHTGVTTIILDTAGLPAHNRLRLLAQEVARLRRRWRIS